MLRLLITLSIVLTATCATTEEEDSVGVLDEDLLQKYVTEIRELRDKGKSWKEVENIMGIWWPEDDERGMPDRFEPRGRAGGEQSDADRIKDMVAQLYKRLAEDQERLDKHPGPKETKYTIPIIKYVANLDDSALMKVLAEP